MYAFNLGVVFLCVIVAALFFAAAFTVGAIFIVANNLIVDYSSNDRKLKRALKDFCSGKGRIE